MTALATLASTHPRAVRGPAGPSPAGPAGDNLAGLVLDQSRRAPNRPAFIEADGLRTVTYGALAARMFDYVAGIRRAALPANARIMLLLRPDAEVYALALAVIASGRTLVLVDGRRGTRGVLDALRAANADVVVGPRALLRWWPLVPALRRARRVASPGALLPPAGRS